MQVIYEVAIGLKHQDYDCQAKAREAVEQAGGGRIVKFIRGSDGKDRSAAMEVYVNGRWEGKNIHGPY